MPQLSMIVAGTAVFIGALLSSRHHLTWIHPCLMGMDPSFVASPKIPPAFIEQLKNVDLQGQQALVTGANGGIGYEISRALSRQGASVTMACRNQERCFAAAEKIRNEDGYYLGATITQLIMDTSDLSSVQNAAKLYLQQHEKLDMLFLNAGIFTATEGEPADRFEDSAPLPLSKDGIEMVFATNVVGHHLLYRMLEEALLQSPMARIVFTTSYMSWFGFDYGVGTDLETINTGTTNYHNSIKLYGQSKLAQILLAKAITKRLQNKNISNAYINAANPGNVRTDMSDNAVNSNVVKRFQDWRVMWTSEEGALMPLFLGVATDHIREKDIRGRFFSPMGVEVVNQQSMDMELQEKVWNLCEDSVKDFITA